MYKHKARPSRHAGPADNEEPSVRLIANNINACSVQSAKLIANQTRGEGEPEFEHGLAN